MSRGAYDLDPAQRKHLARAVRALVRARPGMLTTLEVVQALVGCKMHEHEARAAVEAAIELGYVDYTAGLLLRPWTRKESIGAT